MADKLDTAVTVAVIGAALYSAYLIKNKGLGGFLDTLFTGSSSSNTPPPIKVELDKPTSTPLGDINVTKINDEIIKMSNVGLTSIPGKTDLDLMKYLYPELYATTEPIDTSNKVDIKKKDSLTTSYNLGGSVNDAAIKYQLEMGKKTIQLTPTITADAEAVKSGKVILVKATGSEVLGSPQTTPKQTIAANKAITTSKKEAYVKGSADAAHRKRLASL